jgi:hypothetical protein
MTEFWDQFYVPAIFTPLMTAFAPLRMECAVGPYSSWNVARHGLMEFCYQCVLCETYDVIRSSAWIGVIKLRNGEFLCNEEIIHTLQNVRGVGVTWLITFGGEIYYGYFSSYPSIFWLVGSFPSGIVASHSFHCRKIITVSSCVSGDLL